jgi:hypothetical protein
LVVVAFLSLSAALPVLAQEPTDDQAPPAELEITVSLSLVGPPGCGSEKDLASRIAWRTSRVRIVPIGASERRLELLLEVAEGGATATLSLTLPNGRRATRVLRAATCDEAIDAAALVAAVTLDPTASTDPTSPPPDAGSPGAGGTGGAGGTTPLPPPTVRPPEATGGSGGTAAVSSRSELSGAIFVPGEAVSGPAPSPLFGTGFGAMGVWNRGSMLSPAVRLSFVHFFGQRFEETGGTALFSLTTAAVDLCPIRIGTEAVALFPCGTFIGGWLNAEGRQTDNATVNRLDWLVLGGTLLLEWRPIEPLEIELFGTLGRPLVRDSFQFGCEPGAADCQPNLFHVVSSVSVQGGVALGVFFR